MRWQATVVQMDGRRIDLLELTELGAQTQGPESHDEAELGR